MQQYDMVIYPGSKISRLPRLLRFPSLLIRGLAKRKEKYKYSNDGFATNHNLSFLDDPRFQYSKSKAIEAGQFDYKIDLRLHQAIWCVDHALQVDKTAAFVELGTGKGFVMSAVLASCDFMGVDIHATPVYLFDTFSPYATNLKATQSTTFGKNIYYAESFAQVSSTFAKFKNVKLVAGQLPKTLGQMDVERISFLHIDLNAPEIELECIKRLWGKVIKGGIVLIDDYAYAGYAYTNKLFNDFAREFKYSILTNASGQGIIIK
jgi:hypothetical protein